MRGMPTSSRAIIRVETKLVLTRASMFLLPSRGLYILTCKSSIRLVRRKHFQSDVKRNQFCMFFFILSFLSSAASTFLCRCGIVSMYPCLIRYNIHRMSFICTSFFSIQLLRFIAPPMMKSCKHQLCAESVLLAEPTHASAKTNQAQTRRNIEIKDETS